MGLESGTYISDLVSTNPVSSDLRSQGDDHLRLIKSVLQATFPNASAAHYFQTTSSKTANFSIVAADQNKLFYIDTGSGAVTATLPDTTTISAGWSCRFVKTTTDTNPYFVAPNSGTLQSGDQAALAKTRRCIPGHPVEAVWTGATWYVSRAVTQAIGSIQHVWRSSVPVGFENADGSTLASASSNYPDFYKANGNSGVLPDVTGRAMFGKESAATRLTNAGSGITGSTLGSTGGAETVTVAQANLPSVNFTNSLTAADHTHSISLSGTTGAGTAHSHGAGTFAVGTSITNGSDIVHGLSTTGRSASVGSDFNAINNVTISSASLASGSVSGTSASESTHTHSFSASGTSGASGSLAVSGTVSSGGSGTALNKMPPAIVVLAVVVVE